MAISVSSYYDSKLVLLVFFITNVPQERNCVQRQVHQLFLIPVI